jgi:hypothetical protein
MVDGAMGDTSAQAENAGGRRRHAMIASAGRALNQRHLSRLPT